MYSYVFKQWYNNEDLARTTSCFVQFLITFTHSCTRAETYDRMKAWSSIKHSILSGADTGLWKAWSCGNVGYTFTVGSGHSLLLQETQIPNRGILRLPLILPNSSCMRLIVSTQLIVPQASAERSDGASCVKLPSTSWMPCVAYFSCDASQRYVIRRRK